LITTVFSFNRQPPVDFQPAGGSSFFAIVSGDKSPYS
jgi:hypothetical protein